MKVTISAAMRARDVSRPHAEHLADAEAAEADAVRGRPAVSAAPAPAAPAPVVRAPVVPAPVVPAPVVRVDAARGESASGEGRSGGARRRSRGSGRGRASRWGSASEPGVPLTGGVGAGRLVDGRGQLDHWSGV